MPKTKGLLPESLAYRFIARFSALEKYPQMDEALQELVKAMRTAPDYEAAEEFVRDWMLDHADCPKPMDIYQAFDPPNRLPELPRLRYGKEIPEPVYNCRLCEDTGWYLVPIGKTSDGIPVTGAKRCHHPGVTP
jgi:hypothetical protein